MLIDPIKQEAFMASSREVFEEIGIVLDYDKAITGEYEDGSVTITTGSKPRRPKLQKGDKVYFDAWLAAKYPGKDVDSFLWLVNFENVRAVEYAEK